MVDFVDSVTKIEKVFDVKIANGNFMLFHFDIYYGQVQKLYNLS